MSISKATRRILARYPYLEEYMSLGIINNRALARAIFKDVKRELGKDAKIQSIVTAIRRFPMSKSKAEKDRVLGILSMSEVNLKYDVGVLTVKLDSEISKKIEELYNRLGGGNYIMIQGIETLSIVTEEKQLATFEEIFKGKTIKLKKNLASIVAKSPEDIAETPGVIAHLANVLALEKINVVEMMSSYTETCFIVDELDALRAVEAIRREIKRARGIVEQSISLLLSFLCSIRSLNFLD
jgi:aspartokinase